MAGDPSHGDDRPKHLKRASKRVSRNKHIILQKYPPSWGDMLGSKNRRLWHSDCQVGPGAYGFEGQKVDGSLIFAVCAAQEHFAKVKRPE